ncbi:MAG: DUF5591 domain-containing protein [Desulfurococcales archaeon]|nr:DUF5591 domain-containing protein [Desulfurococcales archaeon]
MGHSGERGECSRVVWDGGELDWVDSRGKRLYLRGVGYKYLAEWPFNEGYEKLMSSYTPKRRYKLGLIMPCSYGKPYSQSYIHYIIRSRIADYIRNGLVHEIIVTNAGVIPRELDEYWPYTAYDWNPAYETPEIKECYTRVLAERLTGYLSKFREYYEGFAAYLRWDSDSWRAVVIASRRIGIDIPNLAAKRVDKSEVEKMGLGLGYDEDPDIVLITDSSLNSLRKGLDNLLA